MGEHNFVCCCVGFEYNLQLNVCEKSRKGCDGWGKDVLFYKLKVFTPQSWK